MTETAALPAKRRGRWIYWLTIAAFLAYVPWIVGPYLRSVIVRDAAVTSWSNLATAPIDGQVAFGAASVERVIGPDGVILFIRNDHLSRQDITFMLHLEDEKAIQALFEVARALRRKHFGDRIFTYGFVYTGTFCRNNYESIPKRMLSIKLILSNIDYRIKWAFWKEPIFI